MRIVSCFHDPESCIFRQAFTNYSAWKYDCGTRDQNKCTILCWYPQEERLSSEWKARSPTGHDINNNMSSPLVSATATIGISIQSQIWVFVYTKLHWLVVKQSQSKFWIEHELIWIYRALQIAPETMFWQLKLVLQTSHTKSLKPKSLPQQYSMLLVWQQVR